MKKRIYIATVVFVALVAVAFQQKIPHKALGIYLSPSDKLTSADAIVVVSGSGDRLPHAVELYKQGFAPALILSGAAREGDISNALAMQIAATQSGVPEKAIILEERATNTYENAIYTKEIIVNKNFRNVILVSSPYHQRRAYETFKAVLKGKNIRLQNSPSSPTYWSAKHWWDSDIEKELTRSEITKIVWAKLSGNYHR